MRYDEGPPRGAPKHIDWMKLTPTVSDIEAERKQAALSYGLRALDWPYKQIAHHLGITENRVRYLMEKHAPDGPEAA